jgi:predicted nicotinamide N-methyase
MATGSGLVAIAAALVGATSVTAADIDPFAEAAVRLNARANAVHLSFTGHDLLDGPPPAADVVLCADAWYEGPLATRVTPWLVAAAAAGARVLVGDPGRLYLPDPATGGLTELARYEVRTTTILEDRELLQARVFAVVPPGDR